MGNGEIIRQKRREMRMTQASLAIASGLSLRTVQRIENGHEGQFESIQAISSVLGLEPAATGATTSDGRLLAAHAKEAARINWIAGPWQVPASAAIVAAAGSAPSFAIARIHEFNVRWPDWADGWFVAWLAISLIPYLAIALSWATKIHGSARIASLAAWASGMAGLTLVIWAIARGAIALDFMVAAGAQMACGATALAMVNRRKAPRTGPWIEPTLAGQRELQAWLTTCGSIAIGMAVFMIAAIADDESQLPMLSAGVVSSGILRVGAIVIARGSHRSLRLAVTGATTGLFPLMASVPLAHALPDSSLNIVKAGIMLGAIATQAPWIIGALRRARSSIHQRERSAL